ncbi:N-acetylmuramoyl-L-alanine amidase family protein [Marinirhabdus gelatinilytica]|uniref:N-acetylmuramoyl-L-alanine amidase n=1 Tax=Marinirhabdus gelatinilytica TaxID=1703343 RepID=A0A370QLB2_9FLAO|nr:N-acetylmuramoyl-L-alanine amidase [Marinirhabdus gelatinilytica]RDK89163.1 N-acetylmuramoyl-L-alanine amidase [Marinirhabdus gelatinilytica]
MVRLVTLIAFTFWLMPNLGFGQSHKNGKTIIIIDPGHGGSDSGAVGVNEIREKDKVLNVSKEIISLNESLFGNTYDIYLTRYEDTLISLKDRAALAKKFNADLFVSLHCNHSINSNAKGVEVFVPKQGKYIRESIQMAYQLQKGLKENIGFKSRGVKFANFQVLRESVGYCPTVLIELGFLSNSNEALHLTEEENVLAIALSILSSFQIKK